MERLGNELMNARPLRSVARVAAFAIALSGLWNVGLAQGIDWLQQFGTEGFDDGTAIAADATGVYVAGRVGGVLPGQVQGGKVDGFVRKYDFSGIEIWTRQFSFNENLTEPFAIAVDDTGVYVAGRSLCSLTVSDRCGGFALKMDHHGQSLWTHFWVTAPSGNLTTTVLEPWGIAVDGSRIYVTGDGTDGSNSTAVVSRLDQQGNEIWARTAGTPGAHASGIAVNATGVYVAGTLGTADVRRFDVDGNVTAEYGLGTIQGGISESLAIDDSGIYVSGVPCPPQCQFAATVRKYAYDGTILWTSEVAAPAGVLSRDMAIDEQGIYLTGVSDLFVSSTVSPAAFVRRYDKDDGKVGWTLPLSPPNGSASGDGLATHAGKVYVTGFAVGAFPGHTATPHQDVFVAQVNESMLPFVLSDIRPAAINPKSKGVISLVIFSTPDFDATFVDPLSVRFGPAAAAEVHQRGHLSDVDGDGDTDLVLHFATQATGIVCGDTEASFTGETFAGVAIRGSDSFVTVGCHSSSSGEHHSSGSTSHSGSSTEHHNKNYAEGVPRDSERRIERSEKAKDE